METFTAIIHQEEDMYIAECPEVGTVSQGKTIDESVKNLKEATELYLEEFPIKIKTKSFLLLGILKRFSMIKTSSSFTIEAASFPTSDEK